MKLKRTGEDFTVYLERMKKEHARRARIAGAELAKSPAIILRRGDRVELVVVTGETYPDRPPLRATTFLVDGPWGHENYKTVTAIADELARRDWDEIRAADEDEVIEWTSTPEFVEGSKRVAYVQAANALRYWAGQKGYESAEWRRADDLLRKTDRMDPADIDEAIAIVERELKTVAPASNPVANPAWVTKALAQAYETVAGRVPPAWLPKLTDVRASGPNVTAKMREYGCGKYGCVLPTNDPNVVLKLTTDDTEAEFASDLSHTLVAPVVVDYHTVLRLASTHKGRQIYLLWRDAADAVGEIGGELGKAATDLIEIQHAAAQDVLRLVKQGAPSEQITPLTVPWLDTLDQMADQDEVAELQPLGRGMARVFREQGIFFGDVHAGNLGRVEHDGERRWVITDPGNVLVFRRR
jgi:hypothetical protein